MSFSPSAPIAHTTGKPSCTTLALAHGKRKPITRSPVVFSTATLWSTYLKRRRIWLLVDTIPATCFQLPNSKMAFGLVQEILKRRAM